MNVGRILLLLAIFPGAHAQLPEERPSSSVNPDVLLNLPYTMRLELGLAPLTESPVRGPSQVFTADYWSRAYEERAQLRNRFGIHLTEGPSFRPYLVQETPVPGHPHFGFVQELRWPGASPFTGLQFERRDFLFQGDRLSIRATSELSTLMRGTGLSGSETEIDFLSLLGYRSHSRLVWQLGEPTRELRWQFSAGMDRHAAVQSSTVDLEVLRRF